MSTTCPGGAAAGSHAVADEDREFFDPINETLEPEDLQDLQLSRLQAVVAHSYANSDAYRALCAEAGVEPADIKTLDDVRRLPLHRQAHAPRQLPGQAAHLRPRQHHRGPQHLRHHRQAHAHLGVAPATWTSGSSAMRAPCG